MRVSYQKISPDSSIYVVETIRHGTWANGGGVIIVKSQTVSVQTKRKFADVNFSFLFFPLQV